MKTPIKITRTMFLKYTVDVKTFEGIQEVSDILQKPLCVIDNVVRTQYGVELDDKSKGTFYFVIDGNVMYTYVKKPKGGNKK